MEKFDKTKYDIEYTKNNIRVFRFTLNKKHDEKIISFLENKQNKSEYIKELIRKDMPQN